MKDETSLKAKYPVVLITGASSGLGAAFARLLDETLPDDVALWLVARNEEKLKTFAAGLKHQTRVLALDLRDEASSKRIGDALREQGASVQLLINNAGEGREGRFEELDASSCRSLCDLNVRSQVAVTSTVLPFMEAGSAIVFVASVAAFLPQPGFAAYAASKAFILSFGRALAEELRRREIHVTVTCPNPMLTDFFTHEEKERLLASYKRWGIENPDRVAAKTLGTVRKRKVVVVTSLSGRLVRVLSKIVPVKWVTRYLGNHVSCSL